MPLSTSSGSEHHNNHGRIGAGHHSSPHPISSVNNFVPGQTAVTASQGLYNHHGFRLNHHSIGASSHLHPHHQLADVAPSALVMHAVGQAASAETMLQLQSAVAAANVDYGTVVGSSHAL